MYFTYDANGKLISMNLNGVEYYYIYNGQGDIIGLFDVSGTQVVSYTYDTWGKLISTTGSLAATVGAKNPYRYRGYRYDTETGLYYLQSRYYNPEWGRFINADSNLGNPGQLLTHNLFAYCANNPVMFVDPNGDIFMLITGLIGAAVGGIVAAATGNNVWAGMAIGGAIGLTCGAAAAYIAAGSAIASTGAVLTGMGAGATAAAGAGGAVLAKLGDAFGKLGKYVNNPGIKVDWGQTTSHGLQRMWGRGVTTDMVNSWVQNGKALLQSAGQYLFVTKDGVAVVNAAGQLITAYTRADFDDAMIEVVKKLFGG